jgi:hypothetical protein
MVGAVFFQLGDEALGFQDRYIGCVWCVHGNTNLYRIYRLGVLFFVVAQLAFGSLPAINLFINERRLFM